jgi:hypothetical protein
VSSALPPITGHLPGGSADWYEVTFTGNTNLANFHPAITITGGDGAVFDVYSNCSGAVLGCGDTGNSTGRISWETQYTCQNNNPPCSITDTLSGEGTGFQPIQVSTVYIKVYRTSATPPATCADATFTLNISN